MMKAPTALANMSRVWWSGLWRTILSPAGKGWSFPAATRSLHVLSGSSSRLLYPALPWSTTTTLGVNSSLHLVPTPVTAFRHLRFKSNKAKKDDQPKTCWGRKKMTSVRKTKAYKMKNHKGAVARWLVMGRASGMPSASTSASGGNAGSELRGQFVRGQAGRSHLNRKMRHGKKVAKRAMVLCTPTQRKRLKKLIPYFKRRYLVSNGVMDAA